MNDLLLLATLLGGPQHGYALKKHGGLITGQRGQTREVYALTNKGKQELLRRLGQFTSKEAASENAFHLRVGLFEVLDAASQKRIVTERDLWLAARERHLERLAAAMNLGFWGAEVVRFFREETRRERLWIVSLTRKIARRARRK